MPASSSPDGSIQSWSKKSTSKVALNSRYYGDMTEPLAPSHVLKDWKRAVKVSAKMDLGPPVYWLQP